VPALPARFPADCDTEAMQVQVCINVTHFHLYDDDNYNDACSRVVPDCHRTRISHWLRHQACTRQSHDSTKGLPLYDNKEDGMLFQGM
jgi:hypothetical protein